jgi:hypothetical protein
LPYFIPTNKMKGTNYAKPLTHVYWSPDPGATALKRRQVGKLVVKFCPNSYP